MDGKVTEIKLSKEQVIKAVEALRALIKRRQKKKKLLDDPEKIVLQLCFMKIPQTKNITIKLNVPHPIAQDNIDVCLFVKDLDKTSRDYEPTERHFKELLSKNNVTCITKVIPLKSLKLEYKPFEIKRNLSNMYDLYLADDRIIRLLPTFLGKAFYGRKRIPVQVNLKAKDLKNEIDKAVNNSRCYITGKGSSCMATVAHSGMTTEEIAENIIASADQLSQKIPGGPNNVKLLVIKTLLSPSVTIYAAIGSPVDVTLPEIEHTKNKDTIGPEEITTLVGAKVKVTSDGKVFIIKKRHSRKRKADAATSEKSDNSDDDASLITKSDTKKLKKPKTSKQLSSSKKTGISVKYSSKKKSRPVKKPKN